MIMKDSTTFTLLFKIPTGTPLIFFKIYTQFGHTPSERFASLT
jgi:hypothetical protein